MNAIYRQVSASDGQIMPKCLILSRKMGDNSGESNQLWVDNTVLSDYNCSISGQYRRIGFMVIEWDVTLPPLTGKRTRKAYIYLPDCYYQDDIRRYPVLYMFDGQNVFFD